MKKRFFFMMFLVACLVQVSLWAATRVDLKLRVYEGKRQGSIEPPQFITTSYIQPTITASLQTEFELDKEKAQIKRVFNLQDVVLLTEADLIIGEERAGRSPDSARHYFRLNANAFAVYVVLQKWEASARFLVLFNEIVAEKPQNILTTEMLLVGGHSAVFGFEDRSGKPYFCSFHITGPPDKLLPPPPPPPPAPRVPPEKKKEVEDFERGAVKARDAVNPPRLLKSVEPVYPPEGRQRVERGFVMLNVRTDVQGNVKNVMVIRSSNEIFNEAAISAVKQWKYEPYLEDGQPKELVFTVSLRFEIK